MIEKRGGKKNDLWTSLCINNFISDDANMGTYAKNFTK